MATRPDDTGDDGRRAGPDDTPAPTVTAVEEQLQVATREVETGRVRLSKRVELREETVDVPLLREEVEVRRVAVGRELDAPVDVRHEGDVMIVPVMEEVLVLRKQLVLKEELHVSRRRVEAHRPQQVTLRSERVEVVRTETEDP